MDNRPEGVYATWETYPPEPLAGGKPLLRIERVNGDGSVSTIVLTRDEARVLREAVRA
jgi:hypothetical protein